MTCVQAYLAQLIPSLVYAPKCSSSAAKLRQMLLLPIYWSEESDMANFIVRTLTVTVAAVSAVAITSVTKADEPPTTSPAYIPDAVNEIFFGNSPSFNQRRSLGGQLSTMFGVGGFPEQNIMQDGYDVFNAYNYLLELQTQSDPTLRVPDLMNPYNTSVQFLPTNGSGVVSGSEFIFE